MGKQWKQWDFIFLGSKITADDECTHEIKKHLLFGRKAVTNLDSILKIWDITLLTKVHLVKTMVFPVVVYGCENWSIKKVEYWRIDGLTVVLEKTLEGPLDCKEIKPVSPKGNQSWIFIGRTDAEVEALILWPTDVKNWLIGKDPGKDWRQENEMVGGITDSIDISLRQVSLPCWSPWGRKESDTTEWLNKRWTWIRYQHYPPCVTWNPPSSSFTWRKKWQPTPIFLPGKLHR